MIPELVRPRNLASAHEALHEEAVLMAGGQSVVLLMNTGLLRPERIVLLDRVEGLDGIHVDSDGIRIGAMATHAELAEHPEVTALIPAWDQVFGRIGNARVRHAGTIGGNLVHADPAQDPPVLLTALSATARVQSPEGSRLLDVGALASGPFMPAIADDEILTEIHVPRPPTGHRSTYLKFLPGTLDDYATVSVAAVLTVDPDGVVRAARLAAGAVGPTVVDLTDAAAVLVGSRPDTDVLSALGDRVRAAVQPSSDRRGSSDYKREMAAVIAQRAVLTCLSPSGESTP